MRINGGGCDAYGVSAAFGSTKPFKAPSLMPYADRTTQREYQRRWMASRRAEWFVDKACEHCGTTDRLEIHHRDPEKKVAHAIWSWAAEKRLAELAKCVVLCRDCHEDQHWPHSMPRSPILFAQIRAEEAKSARSKSPLGRGR